MKNANSLALLKADHNRFVELTEQMSIRSLAFDGERKSGRLYNYALLQVYFHVDIFQ